MKLVMVLIFLANLPVSAHADTSGERAHQFCRTLASKEKSGCINEARTAVGNKLKINPAKLRFFENVSVGDGAAATEIILFRSPEPSGPLWKVELNGEDCSVNNLESLG